MKRILVPTDFSINAHNAFRFALHIANEFNASISTVHIGDPVKPYKDYAPETLLQKMESEMEKEFEKLWHDRHIKVHTFKVNDLVMLYDSKFTKFHGKF